MATSPEGEPSPSCSGHEGLGSGRVDRLKTWGQEQSATAVHKTRHSARTNANHVLRPRKHMGNGKHSPGLGGEPCPLLPLLGSGAPPGAAARSEGLVLPAQKYYVKGALLPNRNFVK